MGLRLGGLGFAALGLANSLALGQRLPGNVKPEHYSLRLSPDIAGKSFHGSETLDVVLDAPSATITLNAAELTIGLAKAGGQAATVSFDAEKEQATLTFAEPLAAGPVRLEMEFAGVLSDKLRGFYLSKSKTRSYAVTQFESTDARRAFPCFDEPALKATFDVALTVDTGDTAISNTNIVSDTPAGLGKHTLQFAPTPRMSTYLVAFLVGDFACSKGSAEGVPIRVCSTPEKIKLTPFALSAAEHFLTYYDRYFGIKYPMPKLDLIAIPDFEAGAMENFGAITYRETELLVEDKEGTVGEKKRVAVVVAHEMAHQWFGDMVTMQWWDNLWLNEGFATWMESKAAGEWHPEWHVGQDVANDLDDTMNLDAERTTRTIRATVDTPAQIQGDVRRHLVWQGRRGNRDGGELCGCGGLPAGRSRLPGGAPVCERNRGGLLGGADGYLAPAGRQADGELHRPARRAAVDLWGAPGNRLSRDHDTVLRGWPAGESRRGVDGAGVREDGHHGGVPAFDARVGVAGGKRGYAVLLCERSG